MENTLISLTHYEVILMQMQIDRLRAALGEMLFMLKELDDSDLLAHISKDERDQLARAQALLEGK